MFTPKSLIPLLDLTSLNDNDTTEVIELLCEKAQTVHGNVAAVCVYPQFVATAQGKLPENVALATVVNFPHGNDTLSAVAAQTRQAITDGANEIDLVLPYRELQSGNVDYAFDLTKQIAEICQQNRAKLKVILETGALSPEQTRLAAQTAIAAGADFLKTSTGKIATGATPQAAQILLDEIRANGKNVGIKLSGGVREIAAAQAYAQQAADVFGADWVNAAHFRIGASALLDNLLQAA